MERIFLCPSGQRLWWRMYVVYRVDDCWHVSFVGHVPRDEWLKNRPGCLVHSSRAPKLSSVLRDCRGIAAALDVGTASVASTRVQRTDVVSSRSELSLMRRKEQFARLVLSHKNSEPRVIAGLMGPLAVFSRMGKGLRCGAPSEVEQFAPFPGRRKCKGSPAAGLELFFSEINHGDWVRIYAVYEIDGKPNVTIVGHAPNPEKPDVVNSIGERTYRAPKARFVARDLLGINNVLGVDAAPWPAYRVDNSITPDGTGTWLRLYREQQARAWECVARLSLVHRRTEDRKDLTFVTHGLMGPLSAYLRLFSEIGVTTVPHRVQPNTLYPVRAA